MGRILKLSVDNVHIRLHGICPLNKTVFGLILANWFGKWNLLSGAWNNQQIYHANFSVRVTHLTTLSKSLTKTAYSWVIFFGGQQLLEDVTWSIPTPSSDYEIRNRSWLPPRPLNRLLSSLLLWRFPGSVWTPGFPVRTATNLGAEIPVLVLPRCEDGDMWCLRWPG